MAAAEAWPAPPLSPRLVASRQAPFVGRRQELKILEIMWAEAEAGRRQALFVGGEPGAGKTRLVSEAAGTLHDAGVAVLVGVSTRDGAVPYQPFAEMLDHLFVSTPAGSLGTVVGGAAHDLYRLSAEVARHSVVEAPEAGEVRRDLFDAVAGLFRRLSADRPIAIVLDDLHWAQLPTLALLEHVLQACPDTHMLLLATFRTTAPDRSEEVAARVADLHRLEGVRRVDLDGLDTDAIAEYVRLRTGLPLAELRTSAALLRDRTAGNPFFLREVWADLERQGGLSALRSPHRVPASIGDSLAARLAGLSQEVRHLIELAAILGDSFDMATLVAAGDSEPGVTLALLDSAIALGLVESGSEGQELSFVHALTRQAVLDRLPQSRRMLLHARAAEVLARQPEGAALVPRLAHHYLAAHVLGFHAQALRYSREAGRLAERSLAFEEAAGWFERAASLPECDPLLRSELLLAAAANYVRACQFPEARGIYESLAAMGEPDLRLAAAMGYEEATWRPGLIGSRAADLLVEAVDQCGLSPQDPRYARALGSLGRALALAGELGQARQVSAHAVEVARACGDDGALAHCLTASLWQGTTPDVADVQMARSVEVRRLAKRNHDYETLVAAANFGAMVSYLKGQPDDLAAAIADSERAARATGEPYLRHVYCCLAHAAAFLRGDFAAARRWTDETVKESGASGDDMAEGPHSTQMFMLARETAALGRFRPFLDGNEALSGRWVPGLLALYTELGLEAGMRRTLNHLLERDLSAHIGQAQWPMEMVFMTEAALAVSDLDAVAQLSPFLAALAGTNIAAGTLIATFGSADRYLARVAAATGDGGAAERHFAAALTLDQATRAPVHVAETLTHYALFLADTGEADRARHAASEARALATSVGQGRVLALLGRLPTDPDAYGPDGLTDREIEVLRLLAGGLSNAEVGIRLHISANTAANHVRSILQKTGCANRTQAAMYASRHQLI